MIHYITIHYQDPSWIELQLKYINRNTTKPYKIWSFFGYHNGADAHHVNTIVKNNVESFHFLKSHRCRPRDRPSMRHWKQLDELTNIVLNDPETDETDTFVWLDSDSLIISNINKFLGNLKHVNFAAVQRIENSTTTFPGGDLFPHPCFATCKAGFWEKNNLSWKGDQFDNDINSRMIDTGSYLLSYFTKNKITWTPIRLTSSLTLDPVLFVIYGDIIYHHGGATRKILGKNASLSTMHDDILQYDKVNVQYLQQLRPHISDIIYNDIRQNKIF